MRRVKIVGLGGSLRPSSTSLLVLGPALEAARARGAETELLDVRELDLPMYEHGLVPSASVRRLVEAVSGAHGLLFSSPVYHGSISGSFKNALDWLELLGEHEPPYLADKVVGLVSVAGGVQGLQGINTMEFVVRALRGWTVPLTVPIGRADQLFGEDGTLHDQRVASLLRSLGEEVVRAAVRFA